VRAISAPLQAALAGPVVVLVQLVRIDFPGGTVALNSSNRNFTVGGVEYRGAYGMGSITPVVDQPGEIQGLQLEMNRVDSAFISVALDEADQVQGTPITISTLILDPDTHQQLGVVTDWVGYADKMAISEDGERASVSISAEGRAVDLLRGNPSTYTDADQQALYPGDRAFELVADQSDKPVIWPTRDFFKQ
jgi:hypothetical protein